MTSRVLSWDMPFPPHKKRQPQASRLWNRTVIWVSHTPLYNKGAYTCNCGPHVYTWPRHSQTPPAAARTLAWQQWPRSPGGLTVPPPSLNAPHGSHLPVHGHVTLRRRQQQLALWRCNGSLTAQVGAGHGELPGLDHSLGVLAQAGLAEAVEAGTCRPTQMVIV